MGCVGLPTGFLARVSQVRQDGGQEGLPLRDQAEPAGLGSAGTFKFPGSAYKEEAARYLFQPRVPTLQRLPPTSPAWFTLVQTSPQRKTRSGQAQRASARKCMMWGCRWLDGIEPVPLLAHKSPEDCTTTCTLSSLLLILASTVSASDLCAALPYLVSSPSLRYEFCILVAQSGGRECCTLLMRGTAACQACC